MLIWFIAFSSRGVEITLNELEIGDIIQLSFNGIIYGHTLFVTEVNKDEIKICSHTIDSKNRLLLILYQLNKTLGCYYEFSYG